MTESKRSPRLLFVDNFDSFTFNLVHYFQILGADVKVIRNNYPLHNIQLFDPRGIVFGPGPGNPSQAGITLECIKKYAGSLPLLGICLGHQAIGEAFGAKVIKAQKPMHGKMSQVQNDGKGLFRSLPPNYFVTRYHSLLLEKDSLPSCFEITAWTTDGEIMGIRHKEMLIEGIQFHPESIMTEHGMELLNNFLLQAFCNSSDSILI